MPVEPVPSSESPQPVREWSAVQLPDSLKALPRMLSEDEQRYLIWLTQSKYEGWGAVVDLGCWLGSSTACLAEGLERAGKAGVVHSFDLFRWVCGYMERDSALRMPEGSDFMPEFLRLTSPWAARVRAQQADLFSYRWTGGPIEILFVDAAKNYALTNAILRNFAAVIVPGRTRVIFQDFRYPETHWLPLVTGSRPDLWEEIENTANGYTTTWIAKKAIHGPGGIEGDYGPESFDFATAARIFAERERVDPAGRSYYVQTLLRLALLCGEDEDVARARARVDALQCPKHERMPNWLLESVGSDLVPLAWEAIAKGDARRAVALARRCLRASCPAPYALGPLGFGLSMLGRHEEAEQALQDMRRQLPGRYEPLLSLADVTSGRGRAAFALELLTEALPQIPATSTDGDYAFALLDRIACQPGHLTAAHQLAKTAAPSLLARPKVREHLARIEARGRQGAMHQGGASS